MWWVLAFFLLILLVLTDVVYRFLMSRGYDAFTLVAYSIAGAFVCVVIYGLVWRMRTRTRTGLRLPRGRKEMGALVAIGVLFFAGFMVLREAQIRSPNLGLVNAIAYSSVAFTVLLMHHLYGDALTFGGYVGCAMVVMGIYVIAMSA